MNTATKIAKQKLSVLVQLLQEKIKNDSLENIVINSAMEELAKIGYRYDLDLYPELSINTNFVSAVDNAPTNLAEALLWKMGKWKIYKQFVENYNTNGIMMKQSNVIFTAFAKHLKNSDNPIFDQHVLRSMVAINVKLTSDQKEICKSALVYLKGKSKGKWRPTLSGSEIKTCYELYVAQLNILTANEVSKNSLDKLLMPLGQALKKYTSNYNEFELLCGFNNT